MRVQTFLGQITSNTNEKLFGSALVLLRISFAGLILANGGFAVLPKLEFAPYVVVPFWIIVICFFSGLFTRPASIIFIITLVVVDVAVFPFQQVRALIWPQLFLLSVSLMGVAGGLGNAFGLNGLVLRNIKNPGAIIKFLFS